ncbi:hypothetical protein ASF10_17060 [Flavobacterium sp. Leaf82]|jgi:hypothetical protein|uniref:hypothetical protein n=1 Tax=unclassified Flavobacterium TaxID=196869 RepID=UPI0006F63292|nr:hypothetical protein [Flavobacterium sp. Leaf82]KQO20391.1 hypothetical protein ASF10_17060 [Flavobacterium sp. Leaf82]
MILETYKLRGDEKLLEIAAKFSVTAEEIKELNPNLRIFKSLFGTEYVEHLQSVIIPVKDTEREIIPENLQYKRITDDLIFEKQARYRCEQTVITKINGIVQNHAVTKTEFIIGKHNAENRLFVKMQMTENILHMQPEQMEKIIVLLNDIENVKNDAILLVNANTGKISRIMNHAKIIEKWLQLKEDIRAKYDFIRLEKNKGDFDQFITLAGNQILAQDKLITDLESKLFYQLFFDKYLVVKKDLFEPYKRPFYSQLFSGIALELDFRQDILSESEDEIAIRKVGNLSRKNYNAAQLEQMYNDTYKPLIKYKFSEFSFSYRERSIINTKDQWIESAEVTMIEQVKNNIQIVVEYKLKKIDL